VVVRKHEIECRGWVSCTPLETVEENDVYECWVEVDLVELELEPLDRKHRWGERVWVILPNGAAGAPFLPTNSGGQWICVGGTYIG
jgi:hypothetical protein